MKKSRKINRLKSRFVPVKFSLKEQRKFTDILSGKRKARRMEIRLSIFFQHLKKLY